MFRKIVVWTTGLLLCAVMTNAARAQQEQAEFTRLLEAFYAASKGGDADKILSFYASDRQKEIRSEIKKKEERKFFLLVARAQVPASYQVEHVAVPKDGQKATLYLLGEFPSMPEIHRQRMRGEQMFSFKKEQGQWKIDRILDLDDPDAVKRPSDLTYNSEDAKLEASGEVAGRSKSNAGRCSLMTPLP